jgi:hypothetical protein
LALYWSRTEMRRFGLWILAVVITLVAAVYQRITGPTYPVHGKVTLGESIIKFKLPRSAETTGNCDVTVKAVDPSVSGSLFFRRHNSGNVWTEVSMVRQEDRLTGSIPRQPAAAKLDYRIVLRRDMQEVSLTGTKSVVIRFKGVVQPWVLIPHILVMFLAMLFSTRAGLEALGSSGNPRQLALWTVALLFVGGILLGGVVQWQSFGSFWTGVPLGLDLTDNKTLLVLVVWIAALIAGRRGKPARAWVVAAAIVLLAVYLIPHSLLGTELGN